MNKLNLAILIISIFLLINCQGTANNGFDFENLSSSSGQIEVQMPTEVQLAEAILMYSVPTSSQLAALSVPQQIAHPKEACNGKDDDNDGFIDEMCCSCRPGMLTGDFDGDGIVNLFDAECPLLLFGNKTIWASPDESCADLDHDGKFGLGDTIRVLKIANENQPEAKVASAQ